MLVSVVSRAEGDGWSRLRYAPGNVGYVMAGTVLVEKPGGKAIAWRGRHREEMFRVLRARAGWVEVTPIGRHGEGGGDSGAYGGWTHRQNIKRIYPAKGGARQQATIDGPAHLRDHPKGKVLGDLPDNATVYVYRRQGDWFFVSTVESAAFAGRTADLRQPRGWIAQQALERFVRLGGGNEGEALAMLGVPQSGRQPCAALTKDDVELEWLLTGDSAFPLAFHCSGMLDGDTNLVGLVPKGGKKLLTRRVAPDASSHTLTFAQVVAQLAELLPPAPGR